MSALSVATSADPSQVMSDATAEASVLGALLSYSPKDESHVYEAISGLRAEDFCLSSHRILFRMIRELRESGQPVDLVMLAGLLQERGQAATVGGIAYVAGLTEYHIPGRSLKPHIARLREKSERRALRLGMEQVTKMTEDPLISAEGCAAALQELLLTQEANAQKQERPLSEIVEGFLAEVAERRTESGLAGLTTSLPQLDTLTGGLRRGDCLLLGGRTGEGKSLLASQIALANAARGVNVGILSLEMTEQDVLARMCVQRRLLTAQQLLRPGTLKPAEFERLQATARDLAVRSHIYVDDSPRATLSELSARIWLLAKRRHCELIIVDYAQLIDAHGDEERSRVTRVSRTLAHLKKQFDVALVVLSQFARPQRINERPTKFSFKESGALENDADLCMGIYRPVDEEMRSNGEDELILLKNRRGPTGYVRVMFDSEWLRFEER